MPDRNTSLEQIAALVGSQPATDKAFLEALRRGQDRTVETIARAETAIEGSKALLKRFEKQNKPGG